MEYLVLLMLCLSYARCDDYMVNPDGSRKEYDGIGIGLVHRPSLCDRTSQKGDLVKVNFNCTLSDGTVMDKTYMSRPFEFVLGEHQAIAGLEAGLLDMCQGEVRHLTVPSRWGYGENALGVNIPSRTTLYFFVTMLSFEKVQNAPRATNVFLAIDANNDGLLSSDEVRAYLQKEGVRDVEGQSGIRAMLKAIFQEEDRDNNGYITHPEFSGRKHTEL